MEAVARRRTIARAVSLPDVDRATVEAPVRGRGSNA